MDKFSFIKRKKKSKRSHSSSSSSEDDKYKMKRRLKENEQEISERKCAHKIKRDRGESSDSRIKKSGKLKSRKRRHSESSISTSDSGQDKKRSKKHKKKERKRRKKEKRKRDKREKEQKEKVDGSNFEKVVENEDLLSGPLPPQNQVPAEETLRKRRAMVPMTKEEYEEQQSQVRRVFDPETGRNRLVKGDGEIIEEVVSYQRHKEINKLATKGDGTSFEKFLGLHK